MMNTECQKTMQIWIDTEQKIASFHEFDNHDCICFQTQEHFTSYILSLMEQRFRFM